ncbi:ABC transporter ATP-binding protein [Geopsychrobacter electrodiphilus]|uniref:ABC transporter ATP-binding protein n=1 Tax=Geopsychrobacter electrodiphilus TaxID=225196 RepID=UPI000364DE64|nr:ABC transporter ATP-binding protein [Geopsychrobacter electrodiphilus]
MRVLEAFDLYRFYHIEEEETLALKGVSLALEAGEFIAAQGPSGSGKSTLLACLAGLDEPDGGYVTVAGQRLTRRSEAERAAARVGNIGIMLQSGNLLDHLSVEDNIRLPMVLAAKVDQPYLDELLKMVGLEHRRQARPAQISGGEAARAGLAVALATRPQVLLADEPTGEVDAEIEAQILALLDRYRKNGGAILAVTHSNAVANYADRIIHLFDGRIVTHA